MCSSDLATFVAAAFVMGYSGGVGAHRPSITTYLLVAVIAALAFVIVDLDRPRRGLIMVDQSSLIQLKGSLSGSGELETAGSRR